MKHALVIDERYPNMIQVRSLSFPGRCKWLVLFPEAKNLNLSTKIQALSQA